MCVRGMQAKIPVLPFRDTLFGDHYIFQPDLFFLFCEFILLQRGADCPLREFFLSVLDTHPVRHSPEKTQ